MLQDALWLTSFTCFFALCASFPGKMLGPGEFIFQSYENCDPPVTEFNFFLAQRKYNRTVNVIDMFLTSPWPVSDDIILEVNCEVKGDGGYKPGSFLIKGPFCTTLKSLVGDLFYDIMKAVGVEDCPVPGKSNFTDFYVDSKKLNDQILYGERRAKLQFFIESRHVRRAGAPPPPGFLATPPPPMKLSA